MSDKEPKDKKVKRQDKEITKDKVKEKFEKLHKEDKKIQKLHEHLEKKGWKKRDKDENFYGHESTFEFEDGTQATCMFTIQDYNKENYRQGACMGHVEVKGPNNTEKYSFALIGEETDPMIPDIVTEYTVTDDLDIEEAESYWRCVIEYILNGMGYQLALIIFGLTLSSCAIPPPFSWAAFIAGLAIACLPWWGGALACCGCNCALWCRWFIGCCWC